MYAAGLDGGGPRFTASGERVYAPESLNDLHSHVGPLLRRPPGFNEDGYVEVRFVFNLDGSVADRCIMRSSDRRLARSVLEALDSVSFPPISHRARCVAGSEIRRVLQTVARQSPIRRPSAPRARQRDTPSPDRPLRAGIRGAPR